MYKISPDPRVEPKQLKRQKSSTSDSAGQKQRRRTIRKQPLPDQTMPKQPGEVA